MTREEAITILINYIKPPIIRNDGKSMAHLLALEAIGKAVDALEAEPTKHGRWTNAEYKPYEATCSVCGVRQRLERDNYCPNCGARMSSEGEDDEKGSERVNSESRTENAR